MLNRFRFKMTSLVLGDLVLEYLTPSVNAPQVSQLQTWHLIYWQGQCVCDALFFYLVILNHVLGPCYACFLDMLWVLTRVCNMSLSMLCAHCNIHDMKGYECETCPGITQFVLENLKGAMGRLGHKYHKYLGHFNTCPSNNWLIN